MNECNTNTGLPCIYDRPTKHTRRCGACAIPWPRAPHRRSAVRRPRRRVRALPQAKEQSRQSACEPTERGRVGKMRWVRGWGEWVDSMRAQTGGGGVDERMRSGNQNFSRFFSKYNKIITQHNTIQRNTSQQQDNNNKTTTTKRKTCLFQKNLKQKSVSEK